MNNSDVLGFCLFTSFLNVSPSVAIIRANIVRAVVNTPFLVICICANFVFLKAYRSTPRLHNPSNLLLANLAVTDLLVGIIGQPLYVLRGVLEIFEFHDCRIWNVEKLAVLFSCSVSFGMLLLITIERVIATFISLRYPSICFSAQVWRITIPVWITCFLSIFVLLLNSFAYYILVSLFIFGITILMTAMYWRMCRKAREQRLKITNTANYSFHLQFLKHKKAERTVSWVVGSIFICYFPLLVHLIYVTFKGNTVYDLYVVSTYLTTLVFLNSSLNPFVYCWRNRTIRMAVKKVFTDNLKIS